MTTTSAVIEKIPFGQIPGGGFATLFVLRHDSGVCATFTDYGARWVGWETPDREGKFADVLTGFSAAEAYVAQTAYVGAFCGRHANRIAGGKLWIGGKLHQLAVNNGPNHLHGGEKGFDRYLWQATTGENSVTFRRVSPSGEEGYPGNLDVAVTYTLEADGAVRMDYTATSDALTLMNLTNHAYFNLAGHDQGDCHDHEVRLFARHYLPLDENNIPLGEVRPVTGGIFDFREPATLGKSINAAELAGPRGYDHTFIVDGVPYALRPAAEVHCPRSGRVLRLETTEPTVHLYTGNWFAECIGELAGKNGARYGNRAGFALEAQHAPDSSNQPAFRSNLIFPGTPYCSTTVWRMRAE